MISLRDTLISEDIIEEYFVCNLKKCKGICCVEGDSGAPLFEDELIVLQKILPEVLPYLSSEHKDALNKQGAFVIDPYDREPTTPLVNKADCAYLFRDSENNLRCAIEAAYNDGKISYKKPISCHLYPIRLNKLMSLTALNYHQWQICSDACTLGRELKVPLYKFLKEPLIRRFGDKWYKELEFLAEQYKKQL